MVPGLKFSAMTSKCGHEREEELAALRRLQVDADAALAEVVAQVGRADLAALGVEHRRRRRPPRLAVLRVLDLHDVGAEPGRAAGSRTGAPASVRPRAPARRRAACRTPARLVRHVAELHGDTVRGVLAPLSRWARAARSHLDSRVMRGIISAAGYVPFRRLDRAEIAKTFGSGGGKGTRSVASYDEDTTTHGRRGRPPGRAGRRPTARALGALWFSTANPAYLDKNNASAIHAALRLDSQVSALDFGGALRSGVGALRTALDGNTPRARGRVRHARRPADQRRRVAGRRRRRRGRSSAPTPTVRSWPSTSAPRAPPRSSSSAGARRVRAARGRGRSASARSKYAPLVEQAWNGALEGRRALARPGRPAHHHRHARRVRCAASRPARSVEGRDRRRPRDDRRQHRHRAPGAAAHQRARDGRARPGDRARRARRRRRRAVVPHDRRDLSRTGRSTRSRRRSRNGAPLAYGKFLSWRGSGHARAAAASRARAHLGVGVGAHARSGSTRSSARATTRAASCTCRPPAMSRVGDAVDDMVQAPMSEVEGTIALFTIDRIAYSPSPPDRLRGRRLRRRRPAPGRAHRRRCRQPRDRRPGRDDVPQAVHRRRHPQLLLEGASRRLRQGDRRTWVPTESRTRSRSSGWGARRSASTGTRAPTTC